MNLGLLNLSHVLSATLTLPRRQTYTRTKTKDCTEKSVMKYQMHGQVGRCRIPGKGQILIAKNDTRDGGRWGRLAAEKEETLARSKLTYLARESLSCCVSCATGEGHGPRVLPFLGFPFLSLSRMAHHLVHLPGNRLKKGVVGRSSPSIPCLPRTRGFSKA